MKKSVVWTSSKKESVFIRVPWTYLNNLLRSPLGSRMFSHTLMGEATEMVRASRGAKEPYDGITEVWFENLESLAGDGKSAIIEYLIDFTPQSR